jgi:hypothetical protein
MDSQAYESPERIFGRITMRMIDRQPYYEIEYIENGERKTGYASFSLDIISSYIRQYFILQNDYMWDCQTCGLENHSDFKMSDRFTTVPKDVYEKMQMVDLREEQEERLGDAPILNPKTK